MAKAMIKRTTPMPMSTANMTDRKGKTGRFNMKPLFYLDSKKSEISRKDTKVAKKKIKSQILNFKTGAKDNQDSGFGIQSYHFGFRNSDFRIKKTLDPES